MADTMDFPGRAPGAEGGELWWWLGSLGQIVLAAEDTGGALSAIVVTDPPGAGAPLHVHHAEDETFVILDGEVTFELAGREVTATAGDVVFGPRGVPHSYRVGPSGSRMVFILTPAGFEDLVREMGTPATAPTVPPADAPMPDLERIAAIAAAHRCELLD
jgi:quercetin dioxygenase-like cupin family protein